MATAGDEQSTSPRAREASQDATDLSSIPALHTAPFRRYLAAFGASLLADAVWFIGLGWAASQLRDPLQTSVVMAAGSVPRAVLLVFGGAIADRRGALAMTLWSQRLRLLIMALVVVATFAAGASVQVLILAAVLFGLLDALHMPAAAALPPALLTNDRLPEGQGLVQTVERLSLVAGAPVGGAAVAFGGLAGTAGAATVLLVVGLVVLRTLPTDLRVPVYEKSHRGATVFSDVRAGLAFALAHPVIGPILAVVTAVNIALSAPLNVGVALLSAEHVWTAANFSIVIAAFASGAAVGALSVLAWRPRWPARAGLVWVALGAVGVAALGQSQNPWWAAGIAALVGFTSGPASALLLGLIQSLTPPEQMARVMALVAFSALGVAPVAYFVFGIIAEGLGLKSAFAVCAGAELVGVAFALTRPTVRHARLA